MSRLLLTFFILSVPLSIYADNSSLFDNSYISIAGGVAEPTSSNISILNYDNDGYLKTKLKKSAAYKIALGKQFDNLRLELEFLRIQPSKIRIQEEYIIPTSIDHELKISSNIGFVNILYNLPTLRGMVTPYIGAGIGVAQNHLFDHTITDLAGMTYSPSQKTINFACNVSLGLMIMPVENYYFDFSYKFTDLGKAKGSMSRCDHYECIAIPVVSAKTRVQKHLFMMGVGIKF